MFHIMTFTKIARISTYISLAAPLIVSRSLFFPFITGKILFFRVFTELALVAVAGAIAYGEIPLATLKSTLKRPLFIAITVFTALFTLSAFTAEVPSFAIWSNFERGEGAWQILHYFLFFFLIALLFKGKNDWRRLISAQVVIAALVALYAVGQASNWPLWIIDPPTGRVSGTLGNPAYMGIYMALNAAFAVWITIQSAGKRRIFWGSMAFFEIILFFMAQNRGSFTAVGVGALAMLIIWILQKKRSRKSIISAGIATIIIAGGLGALTLTVKGGEALKGFQPRLWTWESALTGTIERPITGWGPENFPFIFDAYYNPKHYQVESWFDRAHNTPLEYLTTGGIPLFLAYAGIFAVLYLQLFRKKNEGLMPFFAAIPLIYIVNSLVLFETIPLYLMLFLFLGVINAFTEDFKEYKNEEPVHKIKEVVMLKAIFISLCGLMFVSFYTTIYHPLQKNLLILDAMRTNGKTDVEIFQKHETALHYPSLVGNQEELQGLLTFTVSYFNYLRANNFTGQVSKEKIAKIMALNAEEYERGAVRAVGIKTLYIRITGLLAAYQETKDVAYLKEADQLIAKGSLIAPTRIEFIRLIMASAAFKGDTEAYSTAVKKGKALLPTLIWETDMKKFVY